MLDAGKGAAALFVAATNVLPAWVVLPGIDAVQGEGIHQTGPAAAGRRKVRYAVGAASGGPSGEILQAPE